MMCFDQLNPSANASITTIDVVGLDLEENMFDVGDLIEEFSQALITRELFIFRRQCIPLSTCANSLVWWHSHVGQFLNVVFITKQIFGISCSQIKPNECLLLLGC